MDYAHFLRHLSKNVSTGTKRKKKHIIRFAKQSDYEQCLQQLNRLKAGMPELKTIQQLKLIHSFACALYPSSALKTYSLIASVEDDPKIHVHLYSPFTLNPLTPIPFELEHPMIPWGVRHIKASQIWPISTGKKTKVGVIDTGVDYFHPDLRGRIGRGTNLINPNMPPYDDNGHGTHISGTIAASNRKTGIVGVAPSTTIYPIKAFDQDGTAFVSDIILGIDWCVQNRVHVINMSFGMKQKSKALQDAIQRAARAGIIIVASCGNDGRNTVDYPARFPQTISVGATNKKKRVAEFSNNGSKIDIYAPGERIESTWPGGKYSRLSGTSMATSHVSGVVALLLERKRSLSCIAIKQALKKYAVPLLGNNAKKAVGEIQAAKTVRSLSSRKKRNLHSFGGGHAH